MFNFRNRALNMSVILLTILLTSPLHFYVTSGSGDVDFQPFDCYRDLCTSRRQFCSDGERRCKYCQPAHCLDRDRTPAQCKPLCLELASSSTKRPATTATTTVKDVITTAIFPSGLSPGKNIVSSSGNANDFSSRPDAQENGIIITPLMFCLGALVLGLLLVAVLTLLAINLAYTRRLYRRFPSASQGEGTGEMQEGQALLGEGWGSKSSSRTVGGISQCTASSSQPPKCPPTSMPGSCHLSMQDSKSVQTDLSPAHWPCPTYTARTDSQLCLSERRDTIVQPSTDGPASGSDGLRHFKGFDYRLLPESAALEYCHDDPPPVPPPRSPLSLNLYHVAVAEPGQGQPMQGNEETCPKSL